MSSVYDTTVTTLSTFDFSAFGRLLYINHDTSTYIVYQKETASNGKVIKYMDGAWSTIISSGLNIQSYCNAVNYDLERIGISKSSFFECYDFNGTRTVTTSAYGSAAGGARCDGDCTHIAMFMDSVSAFVYSIATNSIVVSGVADTDQFSYGILTNGNLYDLSSGQAIGSNNTVIFDTGIASWDWNITDFYSTNGMFVYHGYDVNTNGPGAIYVFNNDGTIKHVSKTENELDFLGDQTYIYWLSKDGSKVIFRTDDQRIIMYDFNHHTYVDVKAALLADNPEDSAVVDINPESDCYLYRTVVDSKGTSIALLPRFGSNTVAYGTLPYLGIWPADLFRRKRNLGYI
jgi:hypothetical protein